MKNKSGAQITLRESEVFSTRLDGFVVTDSREPGERRFKITAGGWLHNEGSSDPWEPAYYEAIVEADSAALAMLAVIDNVNPWGRIVFEDGDFEWSAFDDSREIDWKVVELA